jgi:HAD superfamily hydrolase (TIGR01490 family)
MKYGAQVPQPKNTLDAAGQRPFAVFDLDGTLVRWQLYHSVFDHLAHLQLIDSALYGEVKAARLSWKKRRSDFRAYEMVLIKAYESVLLTLTPQQMSQAVEAAFEEHKEQVYTYTKGLIADLKARDYVLLAISGSHHEIVERIAQHYGFDDWAGTIYHTKAGVYTGTYTFPAHQKDQALQSFTQKHNLSLQGSIAVGDSEGDIPMLEMVESPIAFNPSKLLYDHARKNGWQIVLERKNVVYKLTPQNHTYQLEM